MRAALTAAALMLAAAAPAAAGPARPDEQALRYYAALGHADRVAAETRRLRRTHPGWQPPADLAASEPGDEDEAPYWEMLEAGRLAEAKAALAARTAADPRWRPSRALALQVRRRAARIAVLDGARAGRWSEVASLSGGPDEGIDPGDVEVQWALAEALARTEKEAAAFAVMTRIMERPQAGADERRATVLKAMALLPMDKAEVLVAMLAPDAFEALAVDVTRARLSAHLQGTGASPVTPDRLAAFEAHAEAAPDPNQAALVGWAAFKERDLDKALDWFKRAIARGGDAMVAHGLAQTLRLLGMTREAEEVAYAWREPLVNNTLLFLDLLEADLTRPLPPPIEPERLLRYARVTAASASGEGAQALAWYAYNTCQFETALDWFRRATAWFPKEATVYGHALTLRRQHRQREFVDLVNRYDGLFPKVVDLLFRRSEDVPLPCEARAVRASPAAATAGGYLDLGKTDSGKTDSGKGDSGKGDRGMRPLVPQPDELDGRDAAALPRVRRSEFPIPVPMENDLRFGTARGRDAAPASRPTSRQPTVARRVPGVGPMPYERYGFTLAPGWNGTDRASAPTAAEAPSPRGTLWAEESQTPQPAARDTAATRSPSAEARLP